MPCPRALRRRFSKSLACGKLPGLSIAHEGSAMRRLAAGLLLFVMASPAWSSEDPAPAAKAADQENVLKPVLTMTVDGLLKLDAAGHLQEFSSNTPMPEPLRAGIDKVVLGWRFKPVLADGVARPVTARMRITLIATREGKNYRVNIDNVIFPGDPKTGAAKDQEVADGISGRKLGAPRYPEELMRRGVSGSVLLALRLNGEGKVVDVVAVQSALKDVIGNPTQLANAIGLLERSAKASAARWTFNVPARLASAPASDLTVNIPVNYWADREAANAGLWRTEVRGARRDIEWLRGQTGLQRPGVSDVKDGETIPVASAVRLETEVIGAAVL
jgi:hypothetical protein